MVVGPFNVNPLEQVFDGWQLPQSNIMPVANAATYRGPGDSTATAVTRAINAANVLGIPLYLPPGMGGPSLSGLAVLTTGNPVFNVMAPPYSAKGDGVTDDTAAIKKAIAAAAAASPGPGTVLLPPGQYVISSTIDIGPYSAGSAQPVPYPSFVSTSATGRIGDGTDVSAVQFICANTFTSGTFAIRVLAPNNNVAPSGMAFGGFGVKCNSLAAGIYIEQPRTMHAFDISVDHAQIPTGNPNGATGAFNVVALNATASAYSTFERIVTSQGLQDGFSHSCVDDSVFSECFDLSSTRYAYFLQGSARWVNCHYEASTRGWVVVTGNVLNVLIGCDYFGIPTDVGISISSGFTGGGNNTPLLAVGCRFACEASVGAGNATVVLCDSGVVAYAKFVGCDFEAYGSHTAWMVSSSAIAGSVLDFDGCVFSGVANLTSGPVSDQHATIRIHNTINYNPVGVVAPAVPLSGSAVAATSYDRTFYVSTVAGTTSCSMAIQNGPTVPFVASVAQVVAVRVPAGKTLTPTYTGTAPTWVVEGE